MSKTSTPPWLQAWRAQMLKVFASVGMNQDAAAGAVGAWVGSFFSDTMLHWILAASFAATALWTLVPDKMDDDEASTARKFGPFLTTLIAFFLAEMGDKTQIATVMLAAKYPHFILVVIGTTLGMLIADVPAVFVGDRLANKIPMKLVHTIAAGIFAHDSGLNALRSSNATAS